jgi:hypothetical protein
MARSGVLIRAGVNLDEITLACEARGGYLTEKMAESVKRMILAFFCKVEDAKATKITKVLNRQRTNKHRDKNDI